MKKSIYFGALGLLSLGALSSCSSEEEQLQKQNLMGEYQISLGIGDMNTRVDWTPDGEDPSDIDECPEVSTVESLIKQNRLYANVEVNYEPGSHPKALEKEEFKLKLEKFANGDMILQPMIVPVGTHNLARLEIIDNNGTPDDYTDDKMIYSGVGVESKYADFVKDEHLLPLEFTLSADQKLQKVKSDMTVLCAVNAIAADFGFEKWNTNFIKVYNIPFHVNTCNLETGHDVAATTVNVYRGKVGEERPTEVFYTKSIEPGSTDMNSFYIIDELNDDKEYYWVEIYDNQNQYMIDVMEGEPADFADLSKYEEEGSNPYWNADYNFLHYSVDGCAACDGYPESATWAGETFDEPTTISSLLEEGWAGLYTAQWHFLQKIEDKVEAGTLMIQQAPHSRFVYSPVFKISEAGKYTIDGDFGKVDMKLIPADHPTYSGLNDVIEGAIEDACGKKEHNNFVDICEPGCYRIQMRVHRAGCAWWCGKSYVNLNDVTLQRLGTCN